MYTHMYLQVYKSKDVFQLKIRFKNSFKNSFGNNISKIVSIHISIGKENNFSPKLALSVEYRIY